MNILMFVSFCSMFTLKYSLPIVRKQIWSSLTKYKNLAIYHQSPNNANVPDIPIEIQQKIDIFRENQKNAKRLSFAEEVRTLIDQSIGYGVISTNSIQYPGYPTGSIVGFEVDEYGLPFFVLSTMSAHTTDILNDDKVSLTITSKDFKGAADGRVVLIGNIKKVIDDDIKAKLKDKYLKKHPNAYWVNFGDFSYFAMETLQAIRFVGGFAMAGSVTPEDYQQAKPDPLAGFAGGVMKHMNDDHADSTVDMVKHYAGIDCSDAQIVSLDKLGMTIIATVSILGGVTKIRLSFPYEVTERKAIKEVLVEMTKASKP